VSLWTVRSTVWVEPLARYVDGRNGHAPRVSARGLEILRELVPEPLACHREDVEVGLPDRRLQVLAGAAADVEDVALLGRQHDGRREALHDDVIRERLKVGRPALGSVQGGLRLRPARRSRRGSGAERPWERDGPDRRVEPSIEARLGIGRLEEAREPTDGLGVAQKEEPAGFQGVVKERDELLLELG
jgi:hypothetical protein